MKILHIISGYLGQGGAERLVIDLAEAQAQLGHNITIACLYPTNERSLQVPAIVKVHSFGKTRGLNIKLPFLIKNYINAENPDAVNCHLPALFLYMIPSLLRCNCKFFYTIHSNPIQEEPRKWVRNMRKYFINIGKLKFIGITDKNKDDFEALYGVSDKLTVIYNGRKPLEPTSQYDAVKTEVNEYKTNSDTKVFIAVGRLFEPKNYPLMLKSFYQLISENVVLLILGFGDQNQFKDITPSNVRFLGAKNNVCDYLLCADAFCMSSSFEGMPISIIEAMSVGLPVLSTNVGGIPDIVKDEVNGLLCKTQEVADYVAMLKRYLSLPVAKIDEISKVNRATFAEKYDIALTAKKYIQLYNDGTL